MSAIVRVSKPRFTQLSRHRVPQAMEGEARCDDAFPLELPDELEEVVLKPSRVHGWPRALTQIVMASCAARPSSASLRGAATGMFTHTPRFAVFNVWSIH